MLWTFQRGSEVLHYEIRHAEDGSGFELVFHQPDGRQTCEQFPDSSALNQRVIELQKSLLADGWFVASGSRR